MAKYILKAYFGEKLVESYDTRAPNKLLSVLSHSRMHKAGEDNGWGVLTGAIDRFEVFNSDKEKLFTGNVSTTIDFIKKLR